MPAMLVDIFKENFEHFYDKQLSSTIMSNYEPFWPYFGLLPNLNAITCGPKIIQKSPNDYQDWGTYKY